MRRINSEFVANKRINLVLLFSALGACLVGFIIGYIAFKPSGSTNEIMNNYKRMVEEDNRIDILDRITRDINVQNIDKHLK
jgi:hypothetical protein